MDYVPKQNTYPVCMLKLPKRQTCTTEHIYQFSNWLSKLDKLKCVTKFGTLCRIASQKKFGTLRLVIKFTKFFRFGSQLSYFFDFVVELVLVESVVKFGS